MGQGPAPDGRAVYHNRGISTPTSAQCCRTDRPSATSISLPSIVSFGIALPLLRRRSGLLVLADAALHLRAEMAQQALDRPGRGAAERADGMALDLIGPIEQRVDLVELGIAAHQAGPHAPHPAGSLAIGRAHV